MLMHHELKKADVIFVLGNRDVRVAEYAAQLYLEGWAPVILFSGSGSIHNHKLGRERFVGSTEAEVFADIALKMGVPKEAIIIENESQNTGQNYEFSIKKLKERGIVPTRMILVQKPYMERRTFATGKVWLHDIELIVTSPQISFDNYPIDGRSKEQVINNMVGDLQRIKDYPKKGFQIEQDIPEDVMNAYEFLLSKGYTERLIVERKIDIYKAAGVLIKDRKFLTTRSKGKSIFIAPGGKVEPDEGVENALIRELREELGIDVAISDLSPFGTFFAPAAGDENKYLQMDVFMVKNWSGEISPASEIEEIKWIDSRPPSDIELGSIFRHEVLPRLKGKNLID